MQDESVTASLSNESLSYDFGEGNSPKFSPQISERFQPQTPRNKITFNLQIARGDERHGAAALGQRGAGKCESPALLSAPTPGAPE